MTKSNALERRPNLPRSTTWIYVKTVRSPRGSLSIACRNISKGHFRLHSLENPPFQQTLEGPDISFVQVLGPPRQLPVSFVHESAIVTQRLFQDKSAYMQKHSRKCEWRRLTLAPWGPSRTAQTLVPQTMQCLHRQLNRSLSASVPPPP